jgi:hypothetical protein
MRAIPTRSPHRLTAAALAAAFTLFASLAAAPADAGVPRKPSLLEQLRTGGRVIACRHAGTAPAAGGTRVLSPAGREQARRMGEGIRRQRIPVGSVLAAPGQPVESARIAFGAAAVRPTPALAGADAALPRLFTGAVAAGTNRVLVTDEAAIRRALPTYGSAALNEGDCLVLRLERGEAIVQARIAPDDWARMRATPHAD